MRIKLFNSTNPLHSPADTVGMVIGACPGGRVDSGLTDWLAVRSDRRKVHVAVEEEGNQRMDGRLQREEQVQI